MSKGQNVTTVNRRDWSIGPAHDPYGAQQMTFKHNGHETDLYCDGLGRIWVKFDGVTVFESNDSMDKAVCRQAEETFELFSGLSIKQFDKAYNRLTNFDEDPMGCPSMHM